MVAARNFDILPAIDMRGGRVVRLEQGDFERETAFSVDAAAVATEFADSGAGWIHLVDLDAARTGQSVNSEAVHSVVRAVAGRLRVELAGGLRTETAVAAALDSGVARAVVGTAAIRDASFAGTLVARFGPDRVAVAVDVRNGRAVGDAWSAADEGVDATDTIRRLVDVGVETFEVTAIDRDGLLSGPDLDLYERLVDLCSGTIIASGGITTLDDVRDLRDIGCRGAIIGRALYEGRISVKDALEVATR